MKKQFIFKYFLLILLTSSLLTLSACTSKEDRCEQVAFAAMKYNAITTNMYHSKKLHKACIKKWDAKKNPEWRTCVLNASSQKEIMKCTPPPFISIALMNE